MTDLNRSQPPLHAPFEKFDLIEAQTIRLDNGAPLHIIQAGSQPVFRLEIAIPAGNWYEMKFGLAYFTTKMLKEGTRAKKSDGIALFLDKYGAFLELHAGTDYVFVTLHSLSRYLPHLIPLLEEMMFDSTFPDRELETLKHIKIQKIKVEEEKNNILASQKFRELLFGQKHPYGHTLNEDDILVIGSHDLKNYHKKRFTESYELIISGRIAEEHIRVINRSFGTSTVKLESTDSAEVPLVTGQAKKVLIERQENFQSSIRIGKRLLTKTHEDYIPLLIVNEILGGYFGSRLMKNIREEKGYTYGISSAVAAFNKEGYFIIGTDVKKEFSVATVREVYKEIQILQDHVIGEDELSMVKNYLMGKFLSSITTPFSLGDKFKKIRLYGLTYKYYDRYIDTINTINAEQIRELAEKYLAVDSLTEVVVGGE